MQNPKKRTGTEKNDTESEDEDQDERLSLGDAWLFPIVLSALIRARGPSSDPSDRLDLWCFLVCSWWSNISGRSGSTGYWAGTFQLLGAERYYRWKQAPSGFPGIGRSLCAFQSSINLTCYFLGTERWKSFERFTLNVKKGSANILSLNCRTPSLLLAPFSVIPSALYRYSPAGRRSALLTDVLSLSFSHNALSLLKIDSFKTGTALLSGLFVYDIWWVFGTRVVSYATYFSL